MGVPFEVFEDIEDIEDRAAKKQKKTKKTKKTKKASTTGDDGDIQGIDDIEDRAAKKAKKAKKAKTTGNSTDIEDIEEIEDRGDFKKAYTTGKLVKLGKYYPKGIPVKVLFSFDTGFIKKFGAASMKTLIGLVKKKLAAQIVENADWNDSTNHRNRKEVGLCPEGCRWS